MKRVIFVFFVFVFSLACSGQQRRIALYDLGYTLKMDMKEPANAIKVWDHVHTLATLQGVVNRDAPRLYFLYIENGSVNIDRYWWDKYRKPGKWLAGADTLIYTDAVKLVTAFRKYVKGVVVYDPRVPATSNVASSVAGVEDLIAVRYDLSAGSLYSKLVLSGPRLPVKRWLLNPDGSSLFTGKGRIPGTELVSTHSAKNDAYRWFMEKYVKTGRCNTRYGAYYIDQCWIQKPGAAVINHHTLSNHDFFVSKRGFFFDLSPWGDEKATDEPSARQGEDLNTLKEFLLQAYRRNGSGDHFTYLGGFPPWAFKYTRHAGGKHEDVETEWEYSKVISAYNAFKDADAIGFGALANASFWQHYPLKKTYPQRWVSHAQLKDRGLLDENGKLQLGRRNFYIFYVGDYDASSWVSQTTPTLWDSPDRGKVPLMWCISPVLAQRVPMALEYRRETASANDYFAAADNGAGYLMPGMLQAPRAISGLPDGVGQWARHNLPYYRQWGLSITGFVIDGHAPALNRQGLDAYASFSPDGIVPQKTPLMSLHGNMPVLRAGEDVNQDDPAVAAKIIVSQMQQRKVPFHWFRNILKSPSWYVRVVAEVKKLDPDAELLDAPAFFELYRLFLKGNPEAAAGKPPYN
ncbi:GxGYxYP domain-containing protein [Pedobacter sp. JY14-1]|uniref:GxGYxYP domain-containing protein n=1 Tax=Pedobacter sp. JY14-1 TaxID=3034151 RepID=UPI0023E154AB|nr:GxGYxYP domain-containing protein [Pedobacter sp. JY14-1]